MLLATRLPLLGGNNGTVKNINSRGDVSDVPPPWQLRVLGLSFLILKP